MRPIIVILNASEQVEAVWKFLLETRGYKVAVARGRGDALLLAQQGARAIVCEPGVNLPAAIPVIEYGNGMTPVEVLEKVRLALKPTGHPKVA